MLIFINIWLLVRLDCIIIPKNRQLMEVKKTVQVWLLSFKLLYVTNVCWIFRFFQLLCSLWGISFTFYREEASRYFFHSLLKLWRGHWKDRLQHRRSCQQKSCFGWDQVSKEVQILDHHDSYYPFCQPNQEG